MFIECSDCNYKYLVNSADLKPDGRIVECANCGNQWFQELSEAEKLLFPSEAPLNSNDGLEKYKEKKENNSKEEIKNLPSTIVNEKKFSMFNSILAVIFLFILIVGFWFFRSYGINIFVLINFYINEFFFNFKLIVDDIAKIIYQIVN